MNFEKISNISVDCVVFGYNTNAKSLNVLLMKRHLQVKETVLVDDYVLTGYHVCKNETLDDTATRVLKELTGLTNQYKKQFKAFGAPDRLTGEKDLIWIEHEGFNSRTITIAYYFLLKTEEVEVNNTSYQETWFPIDELPEIGFDHEKIILEAYEDLKIKCLAEPVIFELLPDKFTINEVHEVYQSVLGIEIDNRNFRRKLISKKYIVALDEKKIGSSKKPAQLYMFSKDLYEKMFKKNYLISI